MTGILISQFLRDNGIKQRWLAEQIGISETRLSLMLTNKAPIDAEILFRICDVLGVSSETFRDQQAKEE
jgi:plasmid maintenance system antidote protein VapI